MQENENIANVAEEEPKNSAQETPARNSSNLKNPGIGMKWYHFIVFVQLILAMLFCAGNGVSHLMTASAAAQGIGENALVYIAYPQLKYLEIGMAVAFFCMIIPYALTEKFLWNYKFKGVVLYLVMLPVNLLVTVAYSVILSAILPASMREMTFDSNIIGTVLALVLVSVVYVVPNWIYFKKRRYLFT